MSLKKNVPEHTLSQSHVPGPPHTLWVCMVQTGAAPHSVLYVVGKKAPEHTLSQSHVPGPPHPLWVCMVRTGAALHCVLYVVKKKGTRYHNCTLSQLHVPGTIARTWYKKRTRYHNRTYLVHHTLCGCAWYEQGQHHTACCV